MASLSNLKMPCITLCIVKEILYVICILRKLWVNLMNYILSSFQVDTILLNLLTKHFKSTHYLFLKTINNLWK